MKDFTKRVMTHLIRQWNEETQMIDSQWRPEIYVPLGMAINLLSEIHGYHSDMSLESDFHSHFTRTDRWGKISR